ncbi:MAG: CotH kinase family protein [Flavobacteriales bacterium]|nr:CotH kinase family protein [Flavobacteriales bacterium]MBK7943185.1 CotH kinase family protein [Flavobacteriales bacterium]MBK9701764.1 CotH kinase family protein [Flavobacteriales bacterium]
MSARCAFVLLALLAASGACAQAVRINELRPMTHPADTGWVELYNADMRSVDLVGLQLVRGSYRITLPEQPPLPPGERRVVRMLASRGASSVGDPPVLHLPASGGDLLLFGAGGGRLLDAFSWRHVPPNVSIGRLPDGAGTWSYLPAPSPGAPNHADHRIQGRAPAPAVEHTAEGLRFSACAGCLVAYTTDGSPPSPAHGTQADGPVIMEDDRTLRAVAWRPDLLPSAETWVRSEGGRPGATLCIDPAELNDPERGLLSTGERANHTRTGEAWVRHAHVSLPGLADTAAVAVRLRLSGSGSRSLPKRSFNLSTADGMPRLPLPGGRTWRNVVLRADATPHAMLRNLFAEVAVHRAGDRLEVQPGIPMPLTLNGSPQGAYRLLPAKNEDFLLTRTEAEHLDIVEGPEGRVVKGDRTAYDRALEQLARHAPLDSLQELMDVESLIELACFDLWTGRADHDLNMRCWRPAQPGGRWRWVLYDMDLWAPPEDPSVDRIAEAPLPAAPYLAALLGHPQLRPLLLARLASLTATVLEPRAAAALADSLFAAHAPLMRADHALWRQRMDVPSPEETLAALRTHAQQRSRHLLRDMARHTGSTLRQVSLQAPDPREGRLLVDGIALAPGTHGITAFVGAPLRIQALPAPGFRLTGWKGRTGTSTEWWADPSDDGPVRPLFAPSASGGNGVQ